MFCCRPTSRLAPSRKMRDSKAEVSSSKIKVTKNTSTHSGVGSRTLRLPWLVSRTTWEGQNDLGLLSTGPRFTSRPCMYICFVGLLTVLIARWKISGHQLSKYSTGGNSNQYCHQWNPRTDHSSSTEGSVTSMSFPISMRAVVYTHSRYRSGC